MIKRVTTDKSWIDDSGIEVSLWVFLDQIWYIQGDSEPCGQTYQVAGEIIGSRKCK